MHKCKEGPYLGSVLSSGSSIIREPGCSLVVLPLGEHKGCPQVALSNLLASFASGGCPGREQPGQLQVLPEHSKASQVIPAADPSPAWMLSADWNSGGTMSSAGLAQSKPDIVQNKFS